MALPAGLPPASFRLEGGCLMCSATTAFEIGQRGRICTCGHPVPSRACCCYTTRCSPRRAGSTPGTCFHGDAGPTHLEPESRGKIYKNWRSRWDLHPHSSRRQRVAFLFSYESEMVGSAGNAPVRHFRFCFVTPDLQAGNRITSRNW